MKATPAMIEKVRSLVAPLDTAERRARYRAGDFPRAAAVKNLDVRYAWDVLYSVPNSERWPLFDSLYNSGLTDRHIETILRKVIPPL